MQFNVYMQPITLHLIRTAHQYLKETDKQKEWMNNQDTAAAENITEAVTSIYIIYGLIEHI